MHSRVRTGGNLRITRRLSLALACLVVTGADVGWADPIHGDTIEDPFAPHDTRGTDVRVGTTVGFLYSERIPQVTALGLTAAVGQRFGRIAIESEAAYLKLSEYGPSDLRLGTALRLGVLARVDVVRLGSRVVGPNSLAALYVEGGVGVAWNRWLRPTEDQPSRVVPDDTKRGEALGGIGISIDHRLQEPVVFPRRIAWLLGLRTAVSPHDPDTASVCRGVSCRAAPMMSTSTTVDRAMVFESALQVTW